MARIEHMAMWVTNLEECREFYCNYFDGSAGEKYHNPVKNFSSYFLTFDGGSRLELMHAPGKNGRNSSSLGYAHLAFSVGSMEDVDSLTEKLRNEGFSVIGEPRTTGDGYYESVVEDPEGNPIEITI